MPAKSGNTNWFEEEFGFVEKSAGSFDKLRTSFTEEQGEGGEVVLTSKANGRRFYVGLFETPSVFELRQLLQTCQQQSSGPKQKLSEAQELDIQLNTAADTDSGMDGTEELGGLVFKNITGAVNTLHLQPENAGAVIQVASQFNCLEMIGPGERPESGVTQYAKDHTQGPAAAMSCPAATVYRNYFWNGCGQAGGSKKQLDTTADVAELLGNDKHKYWEMKNGYLMPTGPTTMKALGERLDTEVVQGTGGEEIGLRDAMVASLRVGVHWDTQVKISRTKKSGSSDTPPQRVCQVFSSAVPCSYAKSTTSTAWAPFASAVLDATYEATLSIGAILAAQRKKRQKIYLTSVGGGAFGNRSMWILGALERAMKIHAQSPIDVYLVHYMRIPKGEFDTLEKKFGARGMKGKKKRQSEGGGTKLAKGRPEKPGKEKPAKEEPAKPSGDFGDEHMTAALAGVRQHQQSHRLLREPDVGGAATDEESAGAVSSDA
jgi:hypothetical protein